MELIILLIIYACPAMCALAMLTVSISVAAFLKAACDTLSEQARRTGKYRQRA